MTNEEWIKMKQDYYHSNTVAMTEDGTIDFSPDRYKEVEFNGVSVTYDEYLDIQRSADGTNREYFAKCFYDGGGYTDCKGQIARISKAKEKILFRSIFCRRAYGDGSYFDGTEDHVWMSRKSFEGFQVGDYLSFSAHVYRYLKTSNGKQLDYGLRNPYGIKKIGNYELPSDDELLKQRLMELACETCMYAEHCYGDPCIAAPGYREGIVQMLFELQKEIGRY